MKASQPAIPKREQVLRELDRAEVCLRAVASQWADVPTRFRLRLIRCADRAEALLRAAGMRP